MSERLGKEASGAKKPPQTRNSKQRYKAANVRIDSIDITGARLRQIKPDDPGIAELAMSISELGQLQPVGITEQTRRLVYGRRRVEACLALGLETVWVILLSEDEEARTLAEMDENFCRQELTVLERGEHHLARQKIYQSRYPESLPGKAKKTPKERNNFALLGSYASKVAAKINTSARKVELEIFVVERLGPELVEKLKGTVVADRITDLLKLARTERARREDLVGLLASGTTTSLKQAEAVLDSHGGEAPETATEPLTNPKLTIVSWWRLSALEKPVWTRSLPGLPRS
jgi:ParB/RepB/Spo0J family partition protein